MKPSALGQLVRKLRTARGWRQEDLAKEAQVAQTAISKLETRADYEPGAFTLAAIARALDASVEELLSASARRPESASRKAPRSKVPPGPVNDALRLVNERVDLLLEVVLQNRDRLKGTEVLVPPRRGKRTA